MPEQNAPAPRLIMLPAVLQAEGDAPCFGTISDLTDQGLVFNFQTAPLTQQSVGLVAKLDFDLMGLHHSCKGLIVHIQGKRALLSLRETSTNIHAALQSINQDSMPTLPARLSTQRTQQACHANFMKGMAAVVDAFFSMLPTEIQHNLEQQTRQDVRDEQVHLADKLIPLRSLFMRHYTVAYPMYPEQLDIPLLACSEHPMDPADMARVDEWINRTTIAQQADKELGSVLDTFSRHYNRLLNAAHKPADHPYKPDAVLQRLAHLIDTFQPSPESRALCYRVMGQAFKQHAPSIYEGMQRIMKDAPTELTQDAHQNLSLEQWLKISASGSAASQSSIVAQAADMGQQGELKALLNQLVERLGEHGANIPASEAGAHLPLEEMVPGMLTRDRIFSRFLPPGLGNAGTSGQTQSPLAEPYAGDAASPVLGGLNDLDNDAQQELLAALRQQSPLELAPDKPPPDSQVYPLMEQAEGLLLEYTLNGLTYQSRPDHPAWTLINALDALHMGADIRGQFLDPALHRAVNLAMQWLLGQADVDDALKQVNALLIQIYTQLRAGRVSRRAAHLEALVALVPEPAPFSSHWCVVKRDEDAIPYEVLGQHESAWALLDRSATHLLDIPSEKFLQKIDAGQIEEAPSFDAPFLERIADATLAASLQAVHTFTWQDPASGCLKRNALIDELERRLAHPVTEPPSFCALIEIPTMRPTLSTLPRDELAVLQKHTGELLLAALESGEHCGRLSDVSFMMLFSPQDPALLATRLTQLKADMETLHPVWKMIGAVVPLADSDTQQTPSNTLRRANLACASQRKQASFDLSCLHEVSPPTNQIDPLPFNSLFLRCQEIASCSEGTPSHYEILLGVSEDMTPRHTTQSFVLMAEQTGLVHELDSWVLRETLEWMDRNPAVLGSLNGLSVNFSGNSLTAENHVESIVSLLARYSHLTHKLIFEITETAAIDNLNVAVRTLRTLRRLGCRVALDDFGSGYSSYSYIRSLPLDYLKIDGTYIRNLLTDKTDQALTASMVDVAHALGIKVIAEYVDSEATYFWLKELGVDFVQGYWVHEPERLDTLVLN